MPVDRNKSLREQVEAYKRRQRELEASKEAAEEDSDAGDGDSLETESEFWTEDEKRDFAELERASRLPSPGGPNVGRIVGSVFLGVGALLLLITIPLFWYTRQSVAAEVTAPGVVVENVLRHVAPSPSTDGSRSAGSSDLYYAVVEFRIADGTLKRVEMSEGNWPKAYEEGERVTVRYDPEKPIHARLGGGGPLDFLAPLITGFLGLLFSAVAIGVRRAFGSFQGTTTPPGPASMKP